MKKLKFVTSLPRYNASCGGPFGVALSLIATSIPVNATENENVIPLGQIASARSLAGMSTNAFLVEHRTADRSRWSDDDSAWSPVSPHHSFWSEYVLIRSIQ